MSLFKTTKELQKQARLEKYGLGAFNTNNLEITKSIAAAIKEESAPAIIAVTPSAMKYAGAKQISNIVRTVVEETGIEVALHLDHGGSVADCVECLKQGFSSVMIDGSKLPLEENIAMVKEVVKLAKPLGVSVEAELGRIFGAEEQIVVTEREASFTDPKQSAEFVERTGIDSLAISIGNAHGFYKGRPKLDFDRLKEIQEQTDALLVLHGASGIPEEDVRKAIELGITKVNIDTEIRDAFRRGVTNFIQDNPQVIDPRKILKPAMQEMKEVVKRKISIFMSSGKAK